MELKIEYVPIDSIKPYEKNAKLHPAEQIEQIKASIKEFGFKDAIAVWNNEVVEGHGRLLAAKELGMKELPIVRLDDLTDEQRREYAIVHNKSQELALYDFDNLADELADLDLSDFDFDFGIDTDAEESNVNIDDFFVDAEQKPKEPKKIQCPHCGEWFEV